MKIATTTTTTTEITATETTKPYTISSFVQEYGHDKNDYELWCAIDANLHKAAIEAHKAMIEAKSRDLYAGAWYEDTITEIVGYDGLMLLRMYNHIETCGVMNNERLYAFNKSALKEGEKA